MALTVEIPNHPSRAPWDAKFHESPTKHARVDNDWGNINFPGRTRSFKDPPTERPTTTVDTKPPWRGYNGASQHMLRPSTVADGNLARQTPQASGRQTPQTSSGRHTSNIGRPSTVAAHVASLGADEAVGNAGIRPNTVAAGKDRPLGCRNGRTMASYSQGSEYLPRYYGNKFAGKRLETTHADDSYHPHYVGPTNFRFGPWTSDLNACGVSAFEGLLGPKYAGKKNLSSIGNDGLWATVKSGPSKSESAHWRHESDILRSGRPAPNMHCTYRRGPTHELTQGQVMNLKFGPPRPFGPHTWKIRRRVAPPVEGDVKVPPDQTEGFYSRPIEPLVLRRFKAQHPPRAAGLPTAIELHEKCKKRTIRLLKKADELEVKALDDWAPAPPKEPQEEEVPDPKAKGKKDAKDGKADPKAKGKK